MISVEGQYIFSFSIGSKVDFILESALREFTLIEEAGNILPTFILKFSTLDESIIQMMQEGNDLKVSFGRTQELMIQSSLVVTSYKISRSGFNNRDISAIGIFSALPYNTSSIAKIFGSKSSVEVMKLVVAESKLIPEFNIDKSDDIQTWIRPNISNRKFMNQLWIHSYLKESFIAVGITSGGKFVLKDIKKDLNKPYDWRFTLTVENPDKDIVYDSNYYVSCNTGFVNHWVGYGKEQLIYELESGSSDYISETPSPIMAMTNQLAKKADIEARFSASNIQNDNVHSNYWRASLKNISRLASFSNISIPMTFSNKFVPIQILDKAFLKDDDISQTNQTSDFNSGMYYVTKVSRTLANRKFDTHVMLSRESLNNIVDAT